MMKPVPITIEQEEERMEKLAADESRQEIRIGVIGPSEIVHTIRHVLKAFPTFKPLVRVFQEEEQAPDLAAELKSRVEVLLFSGPLPYKLAQAACHFDIPVHFVPLKGTGLFRALHRLHKEHGLSALSLDSLSRKEVRSALKDLGEEGTELELFKGSMTPSRQEVIEFHSRKFREGRSAAALTGMVSVSEALRAMGIPNELLMPTEQDISVALERALLSTESRRSKESQIVLGFIHVDHFGKMAEGKFSAHHIQRLKLDVHRMLLGYAESLDGHLTYLGGDEYLFMTTRGIFERETGGYKSVPLAKEIGKEYDLSLSIGIGFGRSAGEAGMHARTALRRCKEAGGNFCFIVREDQSMIGPLEMREPLAYDLSLIDANLLQRLGSAGLSPLYLSRLIGSATRQGKLDYYAQELAGILGVTVRSTHRFLTTWSDLGLIHIAGETKRDQKGRPRQIYRLSFLKELLR